SHRSTRAEEIPMRQFVPTQKKDRPARDLRAASTRYKRQRRFHVEALEDRRLMTVLFTPQNGAETAYYGNGERLGTVAPGLPLYSIYWGSWWTNTSDGQTLQAEVQNSLDGIFLNSSYLTGLHQYGVPYPAGVPNSGTFEVNDASDPPSVFSDGDIHSVV